MEEMTSASGSVDISTPQTQDSTQDSVNTNTNTPSFDFREHISDEYRDSKSLESYKDINGLVKSHIEQQKMIGSSIRLPKEGATPEEVDKFYNKLGRPETADKYELNNPEELPEGFTLDEKGTEEFKQLAHQLGLTNQQADALRSHYVNESLEQFKSSNVSQEQQDADFIAKGKEMYGDKYEAVMQNASKLITENLSTDQASVLDKLDNEQLLTVSTLINNLNSKYMKPDTIIANYQPANTAEDKRNELNSLVEKQRSIDNLHPEYDSINAKIKELYSKGIKRFS